MQFVEYVSANTWDDGYSSGGNYWSDYTGVDKLSGSYQNVTGNDGIGDTPFLIDQNNVDHFPLMSSWGRIPGEVSPPPPFWTQWWFYAIVAVVIVTLGGAVYLLKKRKPPTPTATPLLTEST